MKAAALAALAMLFVGTNAEVGPCPNDCSGHGVCIGNKCTCFHGYMAGDCSQRICPSGPAWADPISNEFGHQNAECSNRGLCNREEGICVCDAGFTGKSCEKMECPYNCWGQGKCLSMRYNAIFKDPGVGTVYSYDKVWDADRIFGCVCDLGHKGYDCSLRKCPTGDDPMTVSQVNEKQILKCGATEGFLIFSFRGYISERIPVTSSVDKLKEYLEAIPGLGLVTVKAQKTSDICQGTIEYVEIEFLSSFGDIPKLVLRSTQISDCNDPAADLVDACGGPISVISQADLQEGSFKAVTGTKENLACSGRGRCDETTGICSCYLNYFTSDGEGNIGDRGDCGSATAEIQACPGLISCSGHGYCSQASEYRCTCSAGWASGDCSARTCPKGKAWFSLPISNNRAHELVECSNMGVCDTTTGLCKCMSGFEGAACDKMTCPGSTDKCSGHGTCLSMAQLAMEATENGEFAPKQYGNIPGDPLEWDYDMVQGCMCDPGWEGHDCSLMSCPTGDDPETGWQVGELQYDETQVLKCVADGGTLTIRFRRETTEVLSFDTTPEALKLALITLPTIADVEITYSSGNSLCTSDGSNVVSIHFTQDFGELPPLFVSYGSTLILTGSLPTVTVATHGGSIDGVSSVLGTKENEVCSARGTCNHETGQCVCFNGYGSSDGKGSAGTRGDCGWKIPWAVIEATVV